MATAEVLSRLKMEKEERPSRLLLLRWEWHWSGRSGVQQKEAAECHGEANPPHRCPRLPKEKLAQDGLKEKKKTKLCWAELSQSPLCCQLLPRAVGTSAGGACLGKTPPLKNSC